MIKNTISRIKRVCAIAFIPRVLRGDLRYIPVSYGIQRSAQKSTRSSKSSVGRRKCRGKRPEDPQKYAVSTVCENSLRPESSKCACRCDKGNEGQNMIPVAVKGTPLLSKPAPACRCTDRRRVIEAIFSEPDYNPIQSGRNIPCSLLGNTATHFTVNDDSHDGKLIKDNRINPGTYSITNNAKLLGIEKINEKSGENNSLTKDSRTSPNNDVVLMSDNDDSKLMNTDLCKVTHKEQMNDMSVGKNDNCSSSDVYGTAYENKSLNSEPSISLDTETLNMYKTLKSKNTNYQDTEAGRVNIKYEPETVNSVPESSIFSWETNSKQDKVQLTENTEIKNKDSSITAATTSKEDEEKLTQKLEHMEETPTVEAEKAKIDGFNVTPKVLGNMQKNVYYADNTVDEMAKHCLGSSQRQVDEILMREMEKLGIPLTGQKEPVSQNSNDSKAVYEYDETRKYDSKQKSEIETSKTEKELQKQYIYDFNRTRIADDLVNVNTTPVECTLSQNHKPSAAPSLTTEKQIVRKSEMTENPDILNENTWDKNELDPKHVLTCNETCPISPKPLTESSYSYLEDTQAIYERDVVSNNENIQESTKHTPIAEHENPYDSTKSGNILIENSIKAASLAMTAATEKEILKEDIASPNPAKTNDSPGKYLLGRHRNFPEHYQTNMRAEDLENGSPLYGVSDLEREKPPNEKLQVTSKDLLATSEELKATSQKLQAATEILQTTSKTIQQVSRDSKEVLKIREDTSKHLDKASETIRNAGEKFDTIVTNLESTTEKLQDLCENVEVLISTRTPCVAKSKTGAHTAPSDVTTATGDPCNSNINNERKEDDKTGCSSKSTYTAQQGTNADPLLTISNHFSSTLGALPKVNNETKLSELMKAVQHRNKLIESANYLATAQKKKSVPPLSMPMQNTPVRVIPNYPSLSPKPRVCTPKSPKPKVKFSRCDLNTLDSQANVLGSVYSEDVAVTEEIPNLPDEIVSKLLKLGCILRSTYQEKKERTMEAVMWTRSHHRSRRSRLFRSKNYEPWVPIPSWPRYEKPVKQKLQSPKDGCKSFPPTRAENDPPCKPHSCDTFPVFPNRKFSKLDYHAVLLTKDHAKDRTIDLVENEYSPILSRTFNKTEWTKPKFTDKPYTDSRKDEENIKPEALEVKPINPPKKIDRKKNSSNFVPKSKAPDLMLISNNVNAQFPNLNLERLLLPTLASVSYSIVRHYSDGAQGADDIFWRPRSKIPTEDQIKNMKDDSRATISLGNDAKYLLLTFKTGGEKPILSKSRKKGTIDIQKSNSGEKRQVSLTNGETKAEIIQKVQR